MKHRIEERVRTAKLVCSVLLIFFGAVTIVLSDATEDLAKAVKEANEAQAEATANAPTQPTVKGREDALDRAVRSNEQTQADPNATAAQKTAAQTAEDTARAQADAARGMTNDPDGAKAYRDALARRRAARKRLKEVREQLRQMLPGAVNRPEIEQKIREAERLSGETFPPELAMQLKHLVVSHHGQYDFGSPKLPMTLEAIALTQLDNLDAKIHSFAQLIEEDANVDSPWTTYHANIGRKIYKGSVG